MRGARWTRLAAGLAAAVLMLGGCGGGDGGDGGDDGGTTGATGGAGGDVTISGFAFDPSTLAVSGSTEITIVNEDSATHSFTLDDESVDEEIAGGGSVTVTLDVSETTGFFCRFHPQMTGTVEVA